MSRAAMEQGGGRGNRPTRRGTLQPAAIIWLTLVWVALWGEISLITVLGGILVAVLVCLLLPLPRVRMRSRVRPLALAHLVLRFVGDLVAATWQVAAATFRPRAITSAVIGVRLKTPSDFVLTVVGEMLTLVPGSVVVEAERSTYTLYLHVFDIDDEDQVEAYRHAVWAQEARVVRALGRHLDHLDLPPAQAQAHAMARFEEEYRHERGGGR